MRREQQVDPVLATLAGDPEREVDDGLIEACARSGLSNAAFAGLLRLVMTPFHEAPEMTDEVRAYLDYLRTVDGGRPRATGFSQHPEG